MADEKENIGEEELHGKKKKKAHNDLSEKFQQELFAFIEKYKQSGKSVNNHDEIIMLFLNKTKNINTDLYKQYCYYITSISRQKNIRNVTFANLEEVSIVKNGRLSELLAERQSSNFEDDKQATVFSLRKKHYTASIDGQNDKQLSQKWDALCKARFGKENLSKLIKSTKLLTTLQKLFDELFKEHCSEDQQKSIGKYLSDPVNRPTVKTYLDAFEAAGHKIKDKHVHFALMKDERKNGKIIKGVLSLEKSIVQLTQVSLLSEGILIEEDKKALMNTFDNTFSHTEITTGIFNGLPRSKYLTEKNPHAVFRKLYQVKIEKAKSEAEANQRRALYEKELLKGYLDRANDQIQKQGGKTPKAQLLEQLATISKLQEPEFSTQKNDLIITITTYLQEDYLTDQIKPDLIQAKYKEFGIEEKINFDAYLDFWKQIYDVNNKEAILKVGDKKCILYADKKLITHPENFRSIDNLDQLFSFERTIDFEKSDLIFNTLFGNTPQAYIVDDTTGGIIDTINYEHDIPVYLGEATLSKRLLLDKKSHITVTDMNDPENHKLFTGFPRLDEEDNILEIVDNTGKVLTRIEFKKNDNETNTVGIIDSDKYEITATKRTFSQPGNPPLITQLIQTAVFNQMAPKQNKIPTKSVEEQANLLHENTPTRPHFVSYATDPEQENNDNTADLEKEVNRFTSYRFASTQEIPERILEETARRFPGKEHGELTYKVKAWINQGEIFFHKEYFCKTHNLKDITHEAGILTFTQQDNTKITINEISKIKENANANLLACIQDLKSAKVHEIAHRLFEFHDIKSIIYTTDAHMNITLDQETLCEIADGKSRKRKYKTNKDGHKRPFVEIEQNDSTHIVRLDTLEEQLGNVIEGFSRKGVKWIDASHLDAYQKDYEKFTDLVVANTAQSTTTPPTLQTVNSSRQAMTHRLTSHLEQIDQEFDPTNQSQVEQRAAIQQHLDTLSQQETALTSGRPSQDELNQMHQQQVEAAQFLQQRTPSQQQARTNTAEQRNTTQTNNRNESSPSPTNSPGSSTDGNSEEQIQDTISYNEEEKNKFDAGFASFKGDISAKLEKGSVIFLKENISSIPGRGFNWVKYTIVGLTDETVTLEMSDASEKQVSKKSNIELPRTENSLNKLKKVGKNEVYKFGKEVGTKSGFMHSIKSTLGSRSDIDNFKKTIQHKDAIKKEAVTHVGTLKEKIVGSDRSESIVYKVDRGTNYVTVSSSVPDGNKHEQEKKSLRTKRMDYDTFQMFCFTKGLNPLTSSEVQRAGERLDPRNIANDGLPRQGISLAAIRKGLQAIPETYKKKFEEEQEFQTALATDWLSNLIPNTSILFLDEIKNDLGGTDGLVRQRIQKFKGERAATGDSDKASIHDNPISENIKSNIFENIQSTRKYKYKAAGALLYALEKGGPYFRALSEYANKDGGGWWIKCLLGETARQQFLKERQRKVDQFKSMGGSADEIQSEIVKFELQFIQDATQDKVGRGSKFGREVESHKDSLYGGANSVDPSGFSKKGDFPYMLDAFRGGGIGQNLPWILFSSLEAMKGAVESPDHYNQFYMCILMIFATGMVHMLPQDYINKLKGIGRSRGIPITLLAGDAHASGKAMRILDHIAHNAGIKSFSEFSGYDLNHFDSMHIHNYDMDERKSIRNSFGNWWANHGWTMMDAFNYKNDFLIDIPSDDDPSLVSEQKKNAKIATDYLGGGGVFGGYKGFQDNESVGSIDGQSPFFEEGLLNLSEGSFRSFMMKFNQGQLVSEHSGTMRSNFAGILEQFETNINSSSNKKANHVMTQLLYKKFIKFFEPELGGTAGITEPEERRGESYKNLFGKAIRGEISLEQFIRKSIFKEKDRVDKQTDQVYIANEQISDRMVKETILQFAGLIKKSYNNLTDPAHKADIFSE